MTTTPTPTPTEPDSNSNSNSMFTTTPSTLPPPIDLKRGRFPFSIVWTPLWFITWFLPFIGHMGICNSLGICHDFLGDKYISIDNLGFGHATRSLKIDPDQCHFSPTTDPVAFDAEFDRIVESCTAHFCQTQNYNFFTNNCHSFVCCVLNKLKYKGYTKWNMVWVGAEMFFFSRHVTLLRFLETWIPFLIVVGFFAWPYLTA